MVNSLAGLDDLSVYPVLSVHIFVSTWQLPYSEAYNYSRGYYLHDMFEDEGKDPYATTTIGRLIRGKTDINVFMSEDHVMW